MPTWPNTKDDMPTRNGERNLSAQIGLDHRKRQIHPCGYTCRCPNVAILDMDGITVDEHRWAKALQGIDLAPMGCGPSAIQSSGSSQEEGPTAHRCDAWHSAERSGYDLSYGPTRKLLEHAGLAADGDERIGAGEAPIGDLSKRRIGDKLNA